MIEVEFDDRFVSVCEQHIVKVQALWRGYYTRKQFTELRHRYQSLFTAIEETPDIKIEWTSVYPSLPQIPAKKTVYPGSHTSRKESTPTADILSPSELAQSVKEKKDQPDSVPVTTTTVKDISESNKPLDSIIHLTKTTETSASVQGTSDEISETEQTRKLSDNSGQVTEVEEQREESEECMQSSKDPVQNQTSVWGSEHSIDLQTQIESLKSLDRRALEELRSSTAMELLWVQQAIESRKQYLNLKSGLTSA